MFENSKKPPRLTPNPKKPEKNLNISKDSIKTLNQTLNISEAQENSLYQDALRRIDKNKTRKFTQNLSFDLKEKRSFYLKEKTQQKNQLNLYKKIQKEVLHIINEVLRFDNQNQMLTYIQVLEIMNQLGYLKYQNINAGTNFTIKNNNYFFEERTLVAKMWDILHSGQDKSEQNCIHLKHFINFLAGVEGLNLNFNPFNGLESRDEQGLLTFNRFEENESSFNYEKIHRDFELFYRNKLSHNKSPEFLDKKQQTSICLSKKTSKLAIQHYKKLFDNQETQGKVSLYDRLARKQEIVKDKINQKSLEHSQKILENCTFKPKVHKKNGSFIQNKENCLSIPKKTNIYKKTEEIEYEKQKNNCTFHPILLKPNYAGQKSKTINSKFFIEQRKSIERIEQARIERVFQKSLKERGVFSKDDVLKDIGNLSTTQVKPELMKKYFGNCDKAVHHRSNTNSSFNKSFENYSLTLKSKALYDF